MQKKDISERADLELLLKTFYGRLLKEPLMIPVFEHTDFEHHLPRIIGFWAFVLLDEPMTVGNVFDAHRHLAIDERHFELWIKLFKEAVDEFFLGKIADKAKQNAEVIGFTFLSKMKLNRSIL